MYFVQGTIATIVVKDCVWLRKKYYGRKKLPIHNREIDRLLKGCTGVKRTTGQHPEELWLYRTIRISLIFLQFNTLPMITLQG